MHPICFLTIRSTGWDNSMWFLHLHDVLRHIAQMNTHWAEALITCGAALLVGCAASCACSPRQEKDELFHKHVF